MQALPSVSHRPGAFNNIFVSCALLLRSSLPCPWISTNQAAIHLHSSVQLANCITILGHLRSLSLYFEIRGLREPCALMNVVGSTKPPSSPRGLHCTLRSQILALGIRDLCLLHQLGEKNVVTDDLVNPTPIQGSGASGPCPHLIVYIVLGLTQASGRSHPDIVLVGMLTATGASSIFDQNVGSVMNLHDPTEQGVARFDIYLNVTLDAISPLSKPSATPAPTLQFATRI